MATNKHIAELIIKHRRNSLNACEKEELEVWKNRILELQKQVKTITILFNNNSGGDAHDNAKQLMNMLDIQYDNLNPKQMDLFDLF